MRHQQKRPKAAFFLIAFLALAALLSVVGLDWEFERLFSADELRKGWERIGNFVSALGSPSIEAEFLETEVLPAAAETLSLAFLGVVGGALFGLVLAFFASRATIGVPEGGIRAAFRAIVRNPSLRSLRVLLRVLFIECFRLLLDVFRGVPDFVWAILLIPVFGLSPVTGALALTVSVGGILGKIYSELWDGVDPKRYESVVANGAGPLKLLFYGLMPLTSRSMLSFTLMRAECAIRNASIIGVVGGGGLGTSFAYNLEEGVYDKVVTLLIAILIITMLADLLSNFLRYQLRNDPNAVDRPDANPRREIASTWTGVFAAAAVLFAAVAYLWPELASAFGDVFDAKQWKINYQLHKDLFPPDLSGESILQVVTSVRFPLAIGVLGTLVGVAIAAILSFPASVAFQLHANRFTGERVSMFNRWARGALLLMARGIALIFRAIPEVTWAILLVKFFGFGAVAAVLALALHSAGVLARVFTESIDNTVYRRLEQANYGSRRTTFLYAAVPTAWRDWMTYSFFQFESNVRMGIVLGIVGIGGLGFSFKYAWEYRMFSIAATYLLGMILVTTIIDRTSRALKISRAAIR